MGQKGLIEQSRRYRAFISDRNKALEKIHQNAQVDISRLLYDSLHELEREVLHLSVHGHQTVLNLSSLTYRLENITVQVFSKLVAKIFIRLKSMRKSIYTLSYLGQAEALGQATQIKGSAHVTNTKLIHAMSKKTTQGEDLHTRVWYDCMKLRERIIAAFRLGLIQELSAQDVVAKVQKQYPPINIYSRPPRELSRIKESTYSVGNKKSFNFRYVDEDDWQDAVSDYIDTQLPASRFDKEAINQGANEDSQIQYSWELEQTLTQDFVERVRDGEIDAAKDMGIQEFVWVAILDDATDQCCRERHGLTTSEIAGKVEEEDFESDCDALYPPAHFNCRCQISPVASANEVEGPDWASFKDWLDS